MTPAVALALTLGIAVTADDRTAVNPVYRDLRDTGISLAPRFCCRLPPPSMADGLDAERQAAAIAAVLAGAYPMKQFVRKSVVAPHVLRMSEVDSGDPNHPGRRVDAWFVAFGDFDRLADKEFLDSLLKSGEQDLERPDGGRDWTTADLARRGIVIGPGREKYEGYGHASYDLLKRVRLQLSGHACWSRTGDSILAAAVVDPRFQSDPEFPNRWFAIAKRPSGEATVGPPRPYYGAGFYAKLTRLADPPGAIFVEYHLAFGEPREWFGSTNLLGSKLPAIAQSQVRSVRRELLTGPKQPPRPSSE
jgi:hypothetical protein